ncbi:hypothetical protein K7X08_035746 [Anisodus acutangulus]|uniref:Uncharacterized protein n=2 Tax=Anisodus TaxID=243963 RepID=A0A9Q1RIP0_9SOLA|nr:hypothetical protein K7X08_035746 [Anisodus acutangulus]
MECWCWEEVLEIEAQKFSLPLPLPNWPQGKGFGTGRICLGEIEVVQITKFNKIWGCSPSFGKSNCVSFYKPDEIPKGYCILGHYCQPDGEKHLTGYVLAAKDLTVNQKDTVRDLTSKLPALQKPLNFTLIWSSD